jgi:hypothetical protein
MPHQRPIAEVGLAGVKNSLTRVGCVPLYKELLNVSRVVEEAENFDIATREAVEATPKYQSATNGVRAIF